MKELIGKIRINRKMDKERRKKTKEGKTKKGKITMDKWVIGWMRD